MVSMLAYVSVVLNENQLILLCAVVGINNFRRELKTIAIIIIFSSCVVTV